MSRAIIDRRRPVFVHRHAGRHDEAIPAVSIEDATGLVAERDQVELRGSELFDTADRVVERQRARVERVDARFLEERRLGLGDLGDDLRCPVTAVVERRERALVTRVEPGTSLDDRILEDRARAAPGSNGAPFSIPIVLARRSSPRLARATVRAAPRGAMTRRTRGPNGSSRRTRRRPHRQRSSAVAGRVGQRIEPDLLGVRGRVREPGRAGELQHRSKQREALKCIRREREIPRRDRIRVSGRQDQITTTSTSIEAVRPDVLEGSLPAVHDRSADRAGARRWKLEHHRTGARVDERHQIDRVGARREHLILPVGRTRPVHDLVERARRVASHRLRHHVEAHDRDAPQRRFDRTPRDRPVSRVSVESWRATRSPTCTRLSANRPPSRKSPPASTALPPP